MPDPKKYLSKIVKGSNTLWLKDVEARQAIEDIQSSISGALHWKGYTTTALTDGATTNPIVIDSKDYTAVAGDVVAVQGSGSGAAADKEFVFNGTKWQEFGSTGSLKALAFKDSASATYTPAGTNQASSVTFTGQTDGDFVTGFNQSPVLPSFSEGAFTPASLGVGFYTAGTTPSLGDATTGTFVTGYNNDGVAPSLGNATTGTFVTGYNNDAVAPSLGNATTGTFATEGETSTYDENDESLTFSAASTSSAVTEQGTFSAGSAATLATASAVTAQGTFSAGSAATLATASAVTAQGTFSAGTMASIDVTKFNGGSKASDTWDAGTAPTLSTGKAITAVGTGEAAAQVFSGTEATITVS